MSNYLSPFGSVTVTVPAGEAVAVYSQGFATITRNVGTPNYPTMPQALATVRNGQVVTSTFATGASITIEAVGGLPVLYEVGVAPVVKQDRLLSPVQVAPGALNATGALTPALVLTGLVTSSTAAGVTATLDVGATFEAASDWDANDTIQWSVVNTGPNTFTVTSPDASHTVVGAGAVATGTSASFRTRRSAANTFITYRIA